MYSKIDMIPMKCNCPNLGTYWRVDPSGTRRKKNRKGNPGGQDICVKMCGMEWNGIGNSRKEFCRDIARRSVSEVHS